jgi:pimeloyl-ACP methyl ester carboxylesterase
VLGLLFVGGQAIAQAPAEFKIPAYYIQDQITSVALKGNVLGDPATRPLLVYLPPSYTKEAQKRYPTIYFLHGFGGSETDFAAGGGIGSMATELMAAGKMGEVIIVLPNASSAYGGSWFARNPLTGDYRTYLAKELVTYIDTKYRTLADREHRAVSGISMGGYGALSLAIEYSDVYGTVAALSPVADIQAIADVPGERDPNAIDAFVANYPEVVGVPGVGDFIADIFLCLGRRVDAQSEQAAVFRGPAGQVPGKDGHPGDLAEMGGRGPGPPGQAGRRQAGQDWRPGGQRPRADHDHGGGPRGHPRGRVV